MNSAHDDAIGGYFSVEPRNGSGLTMLKSAACYRSARSAMAAALLEAKPATVWAPNFICGLVNAMLRDIGVPTKTYPITEKFGVPADLKLGHSDILICVDYFGLSGDEVDAAIQRYGADRILVDASQSLFLKPNPDCTTVFSPRKFVGIPDGGLLLSPRLLAPALPADELGSIFRSRHLRTRASGHVEDGYKEYQQAESSLANCGAYAMSELTKTMIGGIDFNEVALRRRENYRTLERALSAHGFETLDLPKASVPLCFPVLNLATDKLRLRLASLRIFAPAYWPDASIPASDHVATMLRERALYLPCDQRYGAFEMKRVIKALIEQEDCA